jgi:hypothetical protein
MSDLPLCYVCWSPPEVFCQFLSPGANGICPNQPPPQPWHDEMTNLPLCHDCWSTQELFGQFLPPSASGISQTQTIDLLVMRGVFYNFSSTTAQLLLLCIYSLPVSVALARLKPLTLGWWDDWSTTVLPPLVNQKTLFAIFSLPVPVALARLKPLTLGWWDEWSTTVLPLMVNPRAFLTVSLSRCQWH